MRTPHILIIRFSALGDVAMAVPVVFSLAKTYPNLRVTVLSKPFAAPLFEGLAPNVGFMAADTKGEYRGVKGLNALHRRLLAKRFSCVADFHDSLRSKYLRMMFSAARTPVHHINKHYLGKRWLTSATDKLMERQPTSFENYAEVLAKLGYPVEVNFHSIFPPQGGDLSALPAPLDAKPEGQRWIGVAPFAPHPEKTYPPDKMGQVMARLLAEDPRCRILLFGAKGVEQSWIDSYAERFDRVVNASALAKGLREELIVMSHLDVMVSMDSENMHLASLTGTPVVSVWGATHPYAGFMGWGQSEQNAVQTDLPCRPCSVFGNKKCLRGDIACLQNIPPSAIAEGWRPC